MAEQEPYPPDPPDGDPHAPAPRLGARSRAVAARQQGTRNGVKTYKHSPGKLLAKERQRKALELRKGGATYEAIAAAVGYKGGEGARRAVERAISRSLQEPAHEVRSLQVERLNHMLLTLWPKVQAGDERAIDTALRVMDKIDRLLGTEAAVAPVTATTNNVLVIGGDKEDYIAAMKRMVGLVDPSTGMNVPQQALPMSPASQQTVTSTTVEEREVDGR